MKRDDLQKCCTHHCSLIEFFCVILAFLFLNTIWSKPFIGTTWFASAMDCKLRSIVHYKEILKVLRPQKSKPTRNDRKPVNKCTNLKRMDFFESFVSAKVTLWSFDTIFDFILKSRVSIRQKFIFIECLI